MKGFIRYQLTRRTDSRRENRERVVRAMLGIPGVVSVHRLQGKQLLMVVDAPTEAEIDIAMEALHEPNPGVWFEDAHISKEDFFPPAKTSAWVRIDGLPVRTIYHRESGFWQKLDNSRHQQIRLGDDGPILIGQPMTFDPDEKVVVVIDADTE